MSAPYSSFLQISIDRLGFERVTTRCYDPELRGDRYAEVFGETTNARNKQWLLKKIIWRIQSIAEGDLSERARARAMEIVNDSDIRRRPPKAPAIKPEARVGGSS
ncbi:MAG: DUF2924 domain-containing protein [Pirellula sp.]|jgi:hypothetical protein|nr:DUF2924 domain-containing protein [Pirellula sp.]